MSNDCNFFQAPVWGPPVGSFSWSSSSDWRSNSRLYHQRCDSANGTKIFVSRRGGSVVSTSDLTRRFMRTFIILCALASAPCLPPFPRSNASSKAVLSGKTSGNRKFSRAQSSCRSFWSGVPVNSKARSACNRRTALLMSASSFFIT